MGKMADAHVNPRIIVENDWESALREVDAKCWVTFRQNTAESTEVQRIHGNIKCVAISGNGRPYLTSSDGFKVDDFNQRLLTVSYRNESLSYQCKFQAPLVSFVTVHNPRKNILCMDVTAGGLAVSCDTDGKTKVWTTNNGEVRRELKGHVGDVYTCRFFPSGVVILTGSADTQLKIWSAETGQCAATLTGHRQGITDSCIVERGRNIVTVSRDGTAKLWNCGKQVCVGTVDNLGGIVNGCSLGVPDKSIDLLQPDSPASDSEVLTEGNLLLLALESGSFQGYGLHSRKKIFSYQCDGAVNCCQLVSDTLGVCGTDTGSVYLLDLRNTGTALQHIKENRSAILSLLPYKQGVFVSTGDGSCFYVNQDYETKYELTGPNCDPVYKVVSDGTHLYTSCRDGLIRKYKPSIL